MIDTTEPEVMEVALQTAPGRCLINSTHLEGGRAKADRVFALAKKYNAAVIVPDHRRSRAWPRPPSASWKLPSASTTSPSNEHGLRPQDLVFDTLTFTLATGDAEFANAAIETIEGIRLIKAALPGVLDLAGGQQRLLWAGRRRRARC